MLAACGPPNHKLTIATFNVQFFDDPFPVSESPCCDLVEDRPAQLAQKILDRDVDVLVINEAFDNEIQELLVEKLSDRYDHHIQGIDGKDGNKFEVGSAEQARDIIAGRPHYWDVSGFAIRMCNIWGMSRLRSYAFQQISRFETSLRQKPQSFHQTN